MFARIMDILKSISEFYYSITPDWLDKFTPVLLLLMVGLFLILVLH